MVFDIAVKQRGGDVERRGIGAIGVGGFKKILDRPHLSHRPPISIPLDWTMSACAFGPCVLFDGNFFSSSNRVLPTTVPSDHETPDFDASLGSDGVPSTIAVTLKVPSRR